MDFQFSHVDALTAIPTLQVPPSLQRLGRLWPSSLGPIIEYAYLRRQREFVHLPALTNLMNSAMAQAVEHALHNGTGLQNTTIKAQDFEIAHLPSEIAQNEMWRAFIRRLVDAGKRASFQDFVAKALGGAFVELANNAIDHSERPNSTCIAYRCVEGAFEMVIADAGIGIRASLFPKYPSLIDDQTALENALTMGITRYPDGTGHGTGFRTVFDALASLGGTLRFRSGVAALVLDGTQFRSLTRKLLQRNHFQGFVATICCRTD